MAVGIDVSLQDGEKVGSDDTTLVGILVGTLVGILVGVLVG